MEKKLSEFIKGEIGVVKSIAGEGLIKRRLFDMGITPGTEITMVKTAPLLDPIEIKIRSYSLSLRKKEAEVITLTMKGD